MNKKLENPVWHSLSETHKKHSIIFNDVKFYNPKICPFGAFTNEINTAKALDEYAKLTDKFFLVSENQVPTWNKDTILLEKKIEGCQMVLDTLTAIDITEEIVPLTEKHIDDVYNLIYLVMPGYYRKRSFDMGNFYGIFKDNKLVSITGQRMQCDDWIEISAVVTHPNYTRRSLAKQLTLHTAKEITNVGKHPILHTTKGNPAIKLYENLGFKITRDMNWWYFHRK